MDTTLVRYLDRFRRLGGETAYVHARGYRTCRWSYAEVAAAASRFARELEARGVSRGDRVLLWGDNCAEWVAAFLGCMLRGATAVPMDRIAAPEFALRVASQVAARLAVCARDLAPHCAGQPVLILEDLSSQIAGRSPEPYPSADIARGDPVEIVFTSGTTADPKGVVITHENVLANLEPLEREIGKYLAYERFVHPLRFLNLLPLSHVFGQFLGVFVPQLLGGTVVFHATLNPTEIIGTIRRERVSVLVAVPRLLQSLKDKIERDCDAAGQGAWLRGQFEASHGEHFLRRWWRFRALHRQFGWKFWAMISGGAALDPETERFWGRLGFAVIQGYGLTETTSIVSVSHPMRLSRGSIGKVLPGRELKLSAEGEILVRGSNIASAYIQGGELKPVLGEEDWFHTGDMGELDGDGNLFFKGRRKNVIVTPEGMNVHPEDLEAALRRQPVVKDCVVVGLQAGGNAEPCAVLLLRDRDADPREVVRQANASLADFQQIRRWQVWPDEDFPRTSTQKPKIAAILERASASGASEGGASTSGALGELLSRVMRRPVPNLGPDAKLEAELQLSSIERVELLGALEDRFQVDLNESRFTAATTVEDLERMLREPVARRTDYKYPRWARRRPAVWARFAAYYLLMRPATVLMARPDVKGRENLEGLQGPLLIIANHITQVDIGFVLFALPFRLRHRLAVAMLGEMLAGMRHPPASMGLLARWREQLSYGLVVALFNVFPLPQQTGFRESFAYAGECADQGFSIVVFPEGRRTLDGSLSPFRAGVGILAKNLGLPVIPIRIDGLFELKVQGRKFSKPGAVRVTVGRAIQAGPDADPAQFATALERAMRELERPPAGGTPIGAAMGAKETQE